MKKILIATLFTAFIFQGAFAQKTNKVIMDTVLHRDVMVGVCTRKGLEQGLFSQWFYNQYNRYHPDTSLINTISGKINKTRITIVFGSWCGDSKMQVGRFYKVLDEAGYKYPTKIIAVTRSLKAGDTNISWLHIRRIPTFIINYRGKEIGRIVESPKVSLEADLATILKKVR